MKTPLLPADLAELRRLREEPKFHPAQDRFYPGAPNEETRLRCAGVIDDMLDALLAAAPAVSERFVLKQFFLSMRRFKGEDSEEIEEAGVYCEMIMDICGIQSSRGILNRGRYGFLLGTFLSLWPHRSG